MASSNDNIGGALVSLVELGVVLVLGYIGFTWLMGQLNASAAAKKSGSGFSLGAASGSGGAGSAGGALGGYGILASLQNLLNGTESTLGGDLQSNDNAIDGSLTDLIPSIGAYNDPFDGNLPTFDPTLTGGGGGGVDLTDPADLNPTDTNDDTTLIGD